MPSKSLCVLAVLTMCSAAPASAQYRNFGVQCTPGAFQACASVELWNETDPGTGQLYLYVRMANVQGTTGFTDLLRSGLAGWTIDNVTLENYTPWSGVWGSDVSMRSESFSGYGDLAGDTYYCDWTSVCAPHNGPSVGEYVQATQLADGSWRMFNDIRSDGWHVLFGCATPQPSDGLIGAWGTCEGGTATWATNLGGGAAFALTKDTNVQLAFDVFDDAGNVYVTSCTTGADCSTVTPEPVTMILVGSGLAGMAGVRARRRRRIDDA